jgi:small multidrug resistance pump
VSPYRARLYRLIFAAAAGYNFAFGLWAAILPRSFFALYELSPPLYPAIWACLGMVVVLYGLGYVYAARRLDRAAPFIAIGLLGKLLGPAGWILAVMDGELPVRTVGLILFNDVIWWLPFALFLLEGTRAGAALRASAPYVCAAVNLAAILAMAAFLRLGTEVVPSVADRVAYILRHPVLWRAGWAVWIAAALSLVGFYAWWGSFLRRSTWAVVALGVAAAGLACDLFAESLLIGWVPRDYGRIAPLATLMTGAAANGLYTLAGITLTIATRSLRGFGLALTWAVWLAGGALTASALARSPLAIAVSTGVLFALFCPWTVWLGRVLARAQASAGAATRADLRGVPARQHEPSSGECRRGNTSPRRPAPARAGRTPQPSREET